MPAPRAGGRGIKLRGQRVQPGAVRRRRVQRRRYRGNPKVTVSPVLRQAIENVINSNEETKYVTETLVEEANFNSGIGSTIPGIPDEMYRAIPLLYQAGGALGGSYNRIGKQIQPLSCKVNFRFNFDSRDSNAREIRVVLYMLDGKSNRNYGTQLPATGLPTTFLDDGNGNNVRFQGKYLESKYPIDKDNWRILHKRTFTLSKGMGTLNQNSIATSQGKYHTKEITLNVKMPKSLKYDETITYPSSYAPVWAVGYYYADDTAPDLGLTAGCLHVTARSHLWFKDS